MGISLNTLNSAFQHISRYDDAVDVECEDFEEKWQRYQEGTAECPLVEGSKPTVWTLTPVNNSVHRAQLQGVAHNHGPMGLCVAYAAAGITHVENLTDENGKKVAIKRIFDEGYKVVVESQLALIPAEVLIELGNRLITHQAPNSD